MRTCPSCGEENPERAKFCLACGSSLPIPDSPAREVRKTVTIVFSDVSGSTGLGERLDPESLRRVMERYFDEMRSVLERHGGTVEKFIGDAVMAVFGIPVLHEDDALRAVRAAVEMRVALSALNEDLEKSRGVKLRVRTGVNTGEVVAGDPSRGHALVTGDAVNVAARLEQAAAPGDILIGEPTYALARDAVTVEEMEPLPLKGKVEAVRAFRLIDVSPGAAGHARRLDSPIVGRERELALVTDAFAQAVEDRCCYLFTVLGPAGVGKSRLASELLAQVQARARVLSGRCLPYGKGITFFPLMEIVKQAAGITDDDSPERAHAKIHSLLGDQLDAAVVSERVAQIIGLVEASGALEELFWAFRRLLEALARSRPLVVVVDDVHWGEPGLLDLLEHIAEWSRDAPILLLCLARPELLELRPGWGGGKLNATSMLLEPLAEVECEHLIENLLGSPDLVPAARTRIAEAAEGNPLFIEEMVSMLIDDGLLRRQDGRWVAAGDLGRVSVPATIHALLAARLDRLGDEERQVIERAAVIGKVFYRGAVSELCPEHLRGHISAHINTLLRKDLIRPDQSTLAGQDGFRFRHILIREAAYNGMPKQLRADLHERLARWLEHALGEHLREYEELIAYHYEQAYRYREELGVVDDQARSLAAEAVRHLSQAGRRALMRGDAPSTATLLTRATALVPQGDPRRAGLLVDLGRALSSIGEFAWAESVLKEALKGAEEVGDQCLRCHALLNRFHLNFMIDPEAKAEEARNAAEEAMDVFDERGDDLGLARSWRLMFEVHWRCGRAAAAQDALEHAVAHARRAGDRVEEMESLWWVPLTIGLSPQKATESIKKLDEILEAYHGERKIEAITLIARAHLEAISGRIEEARKLHYRGRALLLDLGMLVAWAGTALGIGWIEASAGNFGAAEKGLREGYETLERLGEKSYLATTAAYLAQVIYAQGRYDEAERFTYASEQAASSDDISSQIVWRSARAKILARRGDFEGAERLMKEALSLREGTDYIEYQGHTLMDLAEVLALSGRAGEAVDAVNKAIELYDQKGSLVGVERARAALERLKGETASSAVNPPA